MAAEADRRRISRNLSRPLDDRRRFLLDRGTQLKGAGKSMHGDAKALAGQGILRRCAAYHASLDRRGCGGRAVDQQQRLAYLKAKFDVKRQRAQVARRLNETYLHCLLYTSPSPRD